MLDALRRHWPAYLKEALGLGAFISSACLITTVVEHPASPVRQAVGDPVQRRDLIGVWMGLTIMGITYAPWGKQSGAHINPAVTWAFRRVGRMTTPDALWYTLAQFAGACLGITLIATMLARWIKHPAVNYVVTEPGPMGPVPKFPPWVAFGGEFVITFVLVLTLLFAVSRKPWERYAGLIAGFLITAYIIVEAPFSGMSLNPARSFASAQAAHSWKAFWVYCLAPMLAALLAADLYGRLNRGERAGPMYPVEAPGEAGEKNSLRGLAK